MNIRFVSRLLIRLGIALLIVHSLHRIMHWPYVFPFLLAGFVLIGIGYPLRFYRKMEKSALDYIKLGLVEFWVLQGVFGYMDWPGYRFLYYSTIVFGVAWLIMGGPSSFFESQHVEKGSFLYKWTIPVLVVLIICVGIGYLLKIMHWPNAGLFLSIGLYGSAAWAVLFAFLSQRSKIFGPRSKP